MTKKTLLSETVRSLVCDRIHTIEQLEVVLLMAAEPETAWTTDSVAARLEIDPELAESALRRCVETELCRPLAGAQPAYTFAPDLPSAQGIRELAAVYPRARVEVLMLISACAMERIRTAQLHTFAQAFLMRKPGSR